MPISSQAAATAGKRRPSSAPSIKSAQFVWRPPSSANNRAPPPPPPTRSIKFRHKSTFGKQQQQQQQRPPPTPTPTPTPTPPNKRPAASSSHNTARAAKTVGQISPPSSCATTSMALNSRLAAGADYRPKQPPATVSLAGRLVLSGGQPNSLVETTNGGGGGGGGLLASATTLGQQEDSALSGNNNSSSSSSNKAPASLSLISKHYQLSGGNHADFYLSRSSLSHSQQQLQQHQAANSSQASSTTHLHPTATSATTTSGHHHHHQHHNHHNHHNHNHHSAAANSARLSISRNMNLKYVKSLIIALMALDLFITIFVHQFSTQDQLQIWLTGYKLRFSLLNLILSAIWFIILIGAILFDVHPILVIACIVDVGSFVLLLILSIVHFYKRIDYNTVQLTSLLALLFSIIFLHVYLLAMSALTIYLTGAVRRRKKTRSPNNSSS